MYNSAGDPRCYDGILHRPRPFSSTHLPMSLLNRAAQFAPFDALTGLGAAIQETARQTEARRELDEDKKSILNTQLQHLRADMHITVLYFRPDERKEGGAYVHVTGTFRKLDPYAQLLCLTDGTCIPIEQIYQLELAEMDLFF